jgi:hypothetical protein
MSFRFDAGQGLVIVRAELWGPSGSAVLHLALDTGATRTLINVGLLVALGYDPALESDRIQVTTGSGVEYAPNVKLAKIKSLSQERTEFAVLVYTSTQRGNRWSAGARFHARQNADRRFRHWHTYACVKS